MLANWCAKAVALFLRHVCGIIYVNSIEFTIRANERAFYGKALEGDWTLAVNIPSALINFKPYRSRVHSETCFSLVVIYRWLLQFSAISKPFSFFLAINPLIWKRFAEAKMLKATFNASSDRDQTFAQSHRWQIITCKTFWSQIHNSTCSAADGAATCKLNKIKINNQQLVLTSATHSPTAKHSSQ
jgi:hypothetical protein